jgi:hypothetical protein
MPVLKVLKSGETNINSTDIWRFAMHSNYPTFKTQNSGTFYLSATDGGGIGYIKEGSVYHGLGYKPQTFITADFSGYTDYEDGNPGKTQDVTGWFTYYHLGGALQVFQSVDENYIYFGISSWDYGDSLTFSYIITLDEI